MIRSIELRKLTAYMAMAVTLVAITASPIKAETAEPISVPSIESVVQTSASALDVEIGTACVIDRVAGTSQGC